MGVMLTIIKVFIILFLLCLWKQGKPWQFSKQKINIYFFLGQTEGERNTFFGGCKKGDHIVRYPQEHLAVMRNEKVCPFVKFEIILPFLCFLLISTNKHCRAWSSMVNFRIDSRTCQKERILLSARQRSNNYLELS